MRLLLSEGSGLTARQAATQLCAAGHVVEVLRADPLALTRFTRHVRRLHAVLPYGDQPFAWLEAALSAFAEGSFEALLRTQEQVAVHPRSEDVLRSAGVRTAVPSFEALAKVQDKVTARATLLELDLPQPKSSRDGPRRSSSRRHRPRRARASVRCRFGWMRLQALRSTWPRTGRWFQSPR